MTDETARLSAVVDAQKSALAAWRRMSDEDSGRLMRYHDALFEIAHGANHKADDRQTISDLRARAARELEATVIRP